MRINNNKKVGKSYCGTYKPTKIEFIFITADNKIYDKINYKNPFVFHLHFILMHSF